MTKIDLGEDIVFTVKYGGAEYSLREPTVSEIEMFKENGEQGSAPVIGLLNKLGMPESVLNKMPVSKIRKLVDGLVGGMTEKK